jgi:thiamine transporter
MNKKNTKLQTVVEVAIFAAIAVVLDMIQGGLFKGIFTSGGSIGIAMVPVLVISYRRGLGWGLLCGLIVSVLQMLSGLYIVQAKDLPDNLKVFGPFLQVMLDYILAYTLVGVAGAFSKLYKNSKTKTNKILFVSIGSIIGGFLKYLSHVLSGILFWLGDGSSSFAGQPNNTHLYSWVYNGLYSIPNIIICTIIMVIFSLFYELILNPDLNQLKSLDYYQVEGEENGKENL